MSKDLKFVGKTIGNLRSELYHGKGNAKVRIGDVQFPHIGINVSEAEAIQIAEELDAWLNENADDYNSVLSDYEPTDEDYVAEAIKNHPDVANALEMKNKVEELKQELVEKVNYIKRLEENTYIPTDEMALKDRVAELEQENAELKDESKKLLEQVVETSEDEVVDPEAEKRDKLLMDVLNSMLEKPQLTKSEMKEIAEGVGIALDADLNADEMFKVIYDEILG